VAVALWAAPALASSSSVTIEWSRTTPLSGTVGNDGWLEVDSTTGGTFPLAVIDGPVVSTDGFAIGGEVSFRGLEGSGYLEMWSVFPDGTRYFSRTLAPAGPLAALSGGSGARTFALPFDPKGVTPSRLEVNLVLPGAGRVRIGPLRLIASTQDTQAGLWSNRAAGLAGGLAGSAIGLMGALLGFLVSRARARRFVLGTMLTLVTVGGAAVGAGAIALFGSQPFMVTYPLVLAGAILVGIFVPGHRAARRAYVSAELRRSKALDRTVS